MSRAGCRDSVMARGVGACSGRHVRHHARRRGAPTVAWQGNVRVQESYVSTGKPEFKTPAGTYQILVKKPVEDMEGVIGGEYYNVPEVPDVLYFTNVGHAFHGTYWHSNLGTPMSHGCVNLPIDVADWLYSWAPIVTRVEIHE